MDSIHEINVANTDTSSYLNRCPDKCLQMEEKDKKNNYIEVCLNKCPQLSYFVCYYDNLLGKEADATLKQNAIHLIEKCRKPYSRMYGYVKSRVPIMMVQETH